MSRKTRPLFWLLVAVLTGCGGNQAPVSSGGQPVIQQTSQRHHRVQSGETLALIARKYGYTYSQLARWNDISPPYTIYRGQDLLIGPPTRTAVAAGGSDRESSATDRQSSAVSVTPLGSQRAVPLLGVPLPATTSSPPPTPASAAAADDQPQLVRPTGTQRDTSGISWRWPTAGSLISDSSSGKGVSIAGREGQPVQAAASGRVVYSGNGLVGLGNLVIIKHDKTYLSAYAHNKKILVKEGDKIDSGQKIAEMGNTGTERTMLYFEIRKDGKPVDPLFYLPRLNQ